MTTFERFERSIPELMTELAPARVPDYFDDMLQQTASHGQRPAWSYPERWLPVEITARPLSMRSVPWRPLAVLALIALLVAAGLAAYVGSQPKLPPGFGPAANGVLLYRGVDGSVVSLDPATGTPATVASASDQLGEPVPSRDGTRVLFIPRSSTPSQIIVGDIDGSDRVRLAGEYLDIEAVDWSPDDGHVAFVANHGGHPAITVAAVDGNGAETLSLERDVAQIRYLPDGRLAIVAAEQPGDPCPSGDPAVSPCALFVVNPDGTGLDLLISAADFHGINTLDVSADGSKLLWVEWDTGAEGRLHVFDLPTHVDHRVPDDAFPTPYSMNRAWFSPDGTAILFDFFESDGDHFGIVPSAGGAPVRIGQKWSDGSAPDAGWAPDGKSILARYGTSGTASELWLLDPTGSGRDKQLQPNVPYLPEWQRVPS
ncbi:MAG: TolB family protein [Chloroflexota bacterium]